MYPILNITIPQEKRKEINAKILYVIDNNLTEKYNITPEIVYNAYTGKGGLHELSFNDYSSFYEYTKKKQSIEEGQFFTPHHICKFIVDCIKPKESDLICDMTAGIGNFANWLPIQENVYLNEIDISCVKIMKYLYPKANITARDIRDYNPDVKMDIVFGNPPFGIDLIVEGNKFKFEYYYFLKANEILKEGGLLAIIVPNYFLEDEFSHKFYIESINNMFELLVQFKLPKDIFSYVGVKNYETKAMILQKRICF